MFGTKPDSTVRLSQSGSREQWTDAFYTKRCPWVSGSWAARYGLNVKCPQRAHVAEHWLPSWWFYLRRWRDLWRQSLAGGRRSVGVGLEIHGQPHFLFILHFLSVNARWQLASCSYSHAFPADCHIFSTTMGYILWNCEPKSVLSPLSCSDQSILS